jgi:FMN phosphatase YigB (HAD superfamily)
MSINQSNIYIFFDDGDTLNDNRIRGQQWQELIGEYFSPRYGGTPESWGAANLELTKDFGGEGVPKLLYNNKDKTFIEFIEWFIEKWINEMFDFVGIKRPEKELYRKIYYGASEYVASQVKAAFPGVSKIIKDLYHKGYNLYLASGTESLELNFYYKAMGIKHYFKKLYGPDLINILKVNEAYYNGIFKDLDILPKQAIFIDDKPYYLNVAENAGAYVVQACLTGKYEPQYEYIITDMKKTPKVIEKLIENKFNK